MDKGAEKLIYWGFSYGTVIGATFALRYPDQVERMVLDGVVDAQDYYNGGWRTSLLDADAVQDKFCEYCERAGSSRCALYDEHGVKARLEAVIDSLKRGPLGVEATSYRSPDIISYSDVMKIIREALYSPIQRFPHMADLLTGISKGNGSLFADMKDKQRQRLPRSCLVDSNSLCQPHNQLLYDGLYGIACSDAPDMSHLTKADFRKYLTGLQTQSHWSGSVWSEFLLPCYAWLARPA